MHQKIWNEFQIHRAVVESIPEIAAVARASRQHSLPYLPDLRLIRYLKFFAVDDSSQLWSSILQFIFETFNLENIVGYSQLSLVSKLKALGFDLIGDLTVWLKKQR